MCKKKYNCISYFLQTYNEYFVYFKRLSTLGYVKTIHFIAFSENFHRLHKLALSNVSYFFDIFSKVKPFASSCYCFLALPNSSMHKHVKGIYVNCYKDFVQNLFAVQDLECCTILTNLSPRRCTCNNRSSSRHVTKQQVFFLF